MANEQTANELRGEGKLPVIFVEAENLAEATHKAIIACHDHGCRIETPKQKAGMSLGYDADMTIRVNSPDAEPKVYFPGMHDTPVGVMQYILEVTHGIHNHWKKCPEHPEWWGYTYNERFVDQLPFIFARIKADWEEKKDQWGAGIGRPSGRDYQFTTWRPDEDIIIEQPDPPCLQSGQIRLLLNKDGELVMNYLTEWRSRDLLKAWNQNNIGQIELMRLLAAKIADMLGVPVKLGAYIDRSRSLHLYGLYVDRDNLEQQVEQMKEAGYESKSMPLEDYFTAVGGKDRTQLKKLIHAQSLAEQAGHGLNQPEDQLAKLGFDVAGTDYPEEWDVWPKSWDRAADPKILAR